MDIRYYYKSFLTLLSGNVISQIIPFLVAPIISRIYSPNDVATFSNLFAIISVLGIIAAGRLELTIPIVSKKRKAQDLVFSGLIFMIIITSVSLIIPLFSDVIVNFYDDENLRSLLWFVPISVLSYGLLLIINNWVLRNKNFRALALNKIIVVGSNNGLTIALGFLSIGSLGMILGWLIAQIIGVFTLLTRVNKKVVRRKTDFNFTLFKSTVNEFKDFPLINSIHAFMDVFSTQFLFFWIITISFGKWELGIYAMMFKYIRGPISLITSSISQVFYVEAGELINKKQPLSELFLKTIKITSIFGVVFSIVILLFGKNLFSLYFGEQWESGGVYAQCILPILFFTFITSPVSGLTILFRRQFTGFILSFFCYGLGVLSFIVSIYYKLSFEYSLLIYSGVFTVYYIIILTWYYAMIRNHDKRLILTD